MDSVFLLSGEARRRFLPNAARILGCAYICLWTPLPHPPNHLALMDGWYHEDDGASSSSGTLSLRLFDAYRQSLCAIDTGIVPGWAYKEGLPYIELPGGSLMNLASMKIQQDFYQAAGIKTAVFMGGKNGEIELGMTTMSNDDTQMNIQRVFSEDFIQQAVLGDILPPPDQSRPSSSGSSLRSLSVGSPEYSSLLLTKARASFMTAGQELLPSQQMTTSAYRSYSGIQLLTPESDDAAMTRAMLAVIASSSSSSSPYLHQTAQQGQASRRVGAFQPYSSFLAPKVESKPGAHSQKMMKRAITILQRMNLIRYQARMQEARPTTTQLHHMISERRRREKLNESFHALRLLLPPGSKRDKASVLANTRDYLNTLKAHIAELEERNRMLEMQLNPPAEAAQEGDTSGDVQVQITRAAESTSEAQQIHLRITVKVECDMTDLVLRVLECLRERGGISLVSVNATSGSPQTNTFARADLTLRVNLDWDEESFKEAVTRAVDGVVARPGTASP